MSLTTNVGAPNSNSFVDLSEADEYIATMVSESDQDGWNDLSDDEKEFRLTLAAEAMGAMLSFRGFRAYVNQALCFPRMLCQEYFGTELTEIPENVKKAQVLIAYFVIHKHIINRPSITETASDSPDISSFSVRGVSISFRQDPGSSSKFTSVFEEIVEDENSMIYLLLNKYTTQIRAANTSDRPAQLVYVEPEE